MQPFRSRLQLLVLILLLAVPAMSQAPVGTISGTIKDATGGVLPGATVTVTSLSTGAQRTVHSNESGFLSRTDADPRRVQGHYRIHRVRHL